MEAEWLEAQKILTTVDLVAAAKLQLAFLAAVDNNRWLYEETALVNAIHRYNACWLPLLAKHSESPTFDLMASRYTQNIGGEGACVYKLRDYDEVLTCVKNLKGVEIEKIPFGTLHIIQKLGCYIDIGKWEPHRPEHLTNEAVDEAIAKLPKKLLDVLLPFQVDGLRFGLRRGGKCLIADEMGLGKTLQAIAIAGCFIHEGSILIVCPAV